MRKPGVHILNMWRMENSKKIMNSHKHPNLRWFNYCISKLSLLIFYFLYLIFTNLDAPAHRNRKNTGKQQLVQSRERCLLYGIFSE